MKYVILVYVLFSGVAFAGVSDTSRYTVYYFLGEDCRICEYYAPEINRLDSLYADADIQFIGLFPSRHSTEKGISDFKKKNNVAIPLKLEYFATKTKEFGVTVTPEVVIYDNRQKQMLYRGRIDDSYVRVGKRRRVIQKRDLEYLLRRLQAEDDLAFTESDAIGCYITFR